MTDAITGALLSGLNAVIEYLAAHVVTCLIPAFFIAGAIAVFIKKEAILQRFLLQIPNRFDVAKRDVRLQGVLVNAGSDGRAISVERMDLPIEDRMHAL